jgi:hypothetical protein
MRCIGGFPIAPVGERSRVSRTVLVVATLVLAGGTLIGATSATAGPAVSEDTPTTYGGFNSCTGESFSGTGTVHTVLSENVSTSGVIQFHLNARIDGLKAVTSTGKKYVVQETLNWEFVFGSAAEETYDATAHYVRQGEDGTFVLGDDFYEYFRAHATANANGVLTAFEIRMSDVPCQ